jgi:Spy/CpxP family protein refolding chaperone
MQLKITIFFLLLLFLSPISSYSQSMGMRPWKKEARCWRASDLNLSPEQRKDLDLLQQTHFWEAQLLRAQLVTRRLEFRELLANPSSTVETLRPKYLEVVETQSKLDEKVIEYIVKVRNLLTQEQLKSWCPEQEYPLFQRMFPGYGPMGPMHPKKIIPPEE